MALSLVEEAERAGVEVDAATVDAVLAALGKVGCEMRPSSADIMR